MSKWNELKALAEAATQGRWVTDGEYVNEHGHVTEAYVAHQDGGRIGLAWANCLVSTDQQCRDNASFIAAANPAAILELIAENERLQGQLIGLMARTFASGLRDRSAEKVLDECLAEGISIQNAELDALRKDAERYQWLIADPAGKSSEGPHAVMWEGEEGYIISGADATTRVDWAMRETDHV